MAWEVVLGENADFGVIPRSFIFHRQTPSLDFVPGVGAARVVCIPQFCFIPKFLLDAVRIAGLGRPWLSLSWESEAALSLEVPRTGLGAPWDGYFPTQSIPGFCVLG